MKASSLTFMTDRRQCQVITQSKLSQEQREIFTEVIVPALVFQGPQVHWACLAEMAVLALVDPVDPVALLDRKETRGTLDTDLCLTEEKPETQGELL